MRISVAEAKEQLADLVRRAEAGDEVILTGQGNAAVRLVPEPEVSPEEFKRRMEAIAEIRASAAGKATPGPSAARSQDFLYDENGFPA
ncbi:type II toxin-antitoxin system Phd/YefM family antitoxin [Phyllobacterium leguminum]|uniref:Antitoxin n=1 Tax=Phyllobacterium leguminum TaxID=314237 RepID=A0A318T365_9HYPH|nr:type II toxin-antitoxin system prevent-host-death family antitoxin [Phyllobacterium leguminum]PYE87095.1 prevent-host-death family protein [Phyllobacterium leguminum]